MDWLSPRASESALLLDSDLPSHRLCVERVSTATHPDWVESLERISERNQRGI